MGEVSTRHSARLILRQWRAGDAEPFADLNADPEVMRYFPGTLSRRESDAMIDRCVDHVAEHDWGLWALERRDTGEFIGFTGLARPRFNAHFTPAVEVGWRLARSAWGHGFATEAARVAVDVGFGELGLEEIVSFTMSANAASRLVMRRLGMTHDPADDFDHPVLPAGHPLSRHVLYRLTPGGGAR